jgi:hypothetical protein
MFGASAEVRRTSAQDPAYRPTRRKSALTSVGADTVQSWVPHEVRSFLMGSAPLASSLPQARPGFLNEPVPGPST